MLKQHLAPFLTYLAPFYSMLDTIFYLIGRHFIGKNGLPIRDDHYPVYRLDIRLDSELATGYGYPKLLLNGNRILIRVSETLLSIFRWFRLLEKVAHCAIIHLFSYHQNHFAFCVMTPSLSMVQSHSPSLIGHAKFFQLSMNLYLVWQDRAFQTLFAAQGCHFGFFEARFWNSGFFEHLWPFLEIKKSQTKCGFFWLFSVRKAWLWKNIVWAAYSLQISFEKSL